MRRRQLQGGGITPAVRQRPECRGSPLLRWAVCASSWRCHDVRCDRPLLHTRSWCCPDTPGAAALLV